MTEKVENVLEECVKITIDRVGSTLSRSNFAEWLNGGEGDLMYVLEGH